MIRHHDQKTVAVLLIEDSPEYAQLVQRWLSAQDNIEFVLNWTDSLALQMVQRGAQDYIIKSKCDSEILVRALQYAVGRSSQITSEEAASNQGTVIGVMGAKGGVGATTFACNLAMELHRQTGQRALLAGWRRNRICSLRCAQPITLLTNTTRATI